MYSNSQEAVRGRKSSARAIGLLASASLLAVGQQAWAEAGKTNTGGPETLEEVVITGSRLQTPGFTSPTPVTALSAQDLQAFAPSDVGDALNKLPQFQNSFNNQQSRTYSSTAAETVQGNYLNLRGLGVTRVLVLFDGQRVPPTDASGGVDLNVLPQMLIKRVDVVTGGASAAYGSDAVTGVVNLILDKNFTGFKGEAQGGVSSRNDDGSYKVGAAYGTSFLGDKAHFLVSAEHYQIDGLRMYDRPLGNSQYVLAGVGTAAAPWTLIKGARFNSLAFGGLITNGPLAGQQFLPNGTLAPFNKGTVSSVSPTTSQGGDGAYYTNNTLNSPLRTEQFYTRFAYDLTPDTSFHVQAAMAESFSTWITANANIPASSLTIFSGNAYLTPAEQTALGATPSFNMGTLRRDIPSNTASQLNDNINFNAGLEGHFGKAWAWDVNYSYGRAVAREKSYEIKFKNFYAAADAVRDPASGNIVCRSTLTNPTAAPGCVPVNLFGEGNISQAALNYIRQPSQLEIVNEMNIVSANVHGELGHTWAGPIAVAAGGEWRHQTFDQTSNANPATPDNFTGIRGVPANTLHFSRLNGGVASGDVSVGEGYIEAGVPLLKDLPLAKSLDFDGAVRVTNYSTSGTVETWKAGLAYVPVDSLRFRATVSRDIAAPTLNQLFAGTTATLSSVVQTDPHTGTTGQYQILTSGNPNLTPERALTYVVGVVYQPEWLPGFTASVDGYHIHIENAITTLGNLDIDNQCDASGGTASVCALIRRPHPFSDRTAANFPISINVAPVNLAELTREGVDVELSYQIPASQLLSRFTGDLTFRAFASYSPTYDRQVSPTAPVIHLAGATDSVAQSSAYPKTSGNVSVSYANGPLRVSVLERFTGSFKASPLFFYASPIRAPNVAYTDLNVSYGFGADRKYEAFLNVQNLFNKNPPFLPDTGNVGLAYPADKTVYDIVGAYVTVGARVRY